MFKFNRSHRKQSDAFKLGFWGRIRRAFNQSVDKLTRFVWRFFTFVPPAWITSAQKVVYHGQYEIKLQDFFNPIYWLLWTLGFIYQWIVSRPYMNLGPALLSMGVGAGIIGLAMRQSFERQDWRGSMYVATSQLASSQGDQNLERLSLVNLVARYPENVTYRRQQALLVFGQGKRDDATRIFAGLVDRFKDPESAYWLVINAFDLEKSTTWNAGQHREFLNLTGIALELKGTRVDYVRAKLAQYLVSVGAPEEAAKNLSQIAMQNPELRLTTAMIYSQIGDQVQTKKWAQTAEQYYDSKLLQQPADNTSRLSLSQALILQHQEEKATRVLAEGAKITQDQSLYSAGAEAIVHWVNRIATDAQDKTSTIPRRLQLLQSAIRIAPQSEVALDAVISLAIECKDIKDPSILQSRAKLMGAVDPQIAHFIEGTIELLAGNTDAAQAHFDIAAKNGEDFPGLMNNLAVALSNRNPPDLDRALELANSALKHLPKHPYVLETRGQILLKLKRFDEAILDLEAALVAQELSGPIHVSLAKAYAEIGSEDKSKIHLELSKASVKK